MATAQAKPSLPWQPWLATLLLLASARPGSGARSAQSAVQWRHAALQPLATEVRSPANDAQFLIQATFGPTRESLQELAGVSYTEWIARQMASPAELHRSYYRERVNPRQVAPQFAGSPRLRCAAGSRWHRFAVERADRDSRLEVRGGQVWVGGELRAEIDPEVVGNGLRPAARCTNAPPAAWRNARGDILRSCSTATAADCSSEAFVQQGACVQSCFDLGVPLDDADCAAGWVNLTYDGFVCDANDAVGGLLLLSSSKSCGGVRRMMRNPAVWLSRQPSITLAQRRFGGMRPGVLLLAGSPNSSAECDLPDIVQVQACEAGTADTCQPGQFARHSPRLGLLRNTPEAPAAKSLAAATACPTVLRNPFNIGSCRVQPACQPGFVAWGVLIRLTPPNLNSLSTVSRRSVYAVAGLPATLPPCGTRSRWVDCSATGIANATRCSASALPAPQQQAVQAALQATSGDVRDINVACDGVPAGAVVQLGGVLFRHVHSDEGNAYDFSEWAGRDPAGAAAILPFVEGGLLRFPASFDAARWTAISAQLAPALLGKLGDNVDFTVLPLSLQLPAVAEAFRPALPLASYYEVCGSPGEVANEPGQGHWYDFATGRLVAGVPWTDREPEVLSHPGFGTWSMVNVWFQKAIHSKDQLRQRMAWALSQTFVQGADFPTEGKLAFYDIFTRHAFGNFRDVLREVTYSPVMGFYLTYLNNKAFHVQGTYPDENFAREVMQLFTIGLWQLHPNGTQQHGANGEALPTYNNFHIENFARVFTGFEAPHWRGNIEIIYFIHTNWVDPMRMQALSHDRFPKADLGDGYLGDGYPLCADLPNDAFLRQGARFEFAGFQQPSGASVVTVNASSPLHRALCQPGAQESSAAPCTFQTVVELAQSVPCHGEQCVWESPRFLLVGGRGYYEFAPPPCVRLFFFKGRQLLENGQLRECVDPATVAGGVACCSSRSMFHPSSCVANSRDVRFSTAEARCASLNMTTCGPLVAGQRLAACSGKLWSNETACRTFLAIDADGRVSPQTDEASRTARFPVSWVDGFPAPSAPSCAEASCTFANGTCICEAVVEATAAFNQLPSEAEVRSLRVGAFLPPFPCFSCSGPVRAYSASGRIDHTTVFEAGGQFWRNLRSMVRVGRRHAFRNPPNFMAPGVPRVRDALNEVDAFLDLLVRHPNTPVFTSYGLIQRFGNSNPSARYLEEVAQAFRTGTYAGKTYSGRYGDLGATLAAILLHPEARADGTAHAGALREPVLKLVHMLRSLEYRDRFGRPAVMSMSLDRTGQVPLMSPTVFNFYKPGFRPRDFLVDKTLQEFVAPEYEIMDSGRLVAQINGLVSAIANGGLSHCTLGFGVPSAGVSLSALSVRTDLSVCQMGDFLATGRLNASTADAVLSELSLLLTGSRLSQGSSAVLRAAYQADFAGPYNNTLLGSPLPGSTSYRNLSDALAAALRNNMAGGVTRGLDGLFRLRSGGSLQRSQGEVSWVKRATPAGKLMAAQTAIVFTPEFNTVGGRVGSRPLAPPTSTPAPLPAALKPYKAVVQLYLGGGADTFQMLVPQNCPLYNEYLSVRRSIAFEPSQLIQVATPNQTCPNFGIHNKLQFVADLYRRGEAAFMSNVGSLAEPLLSRQEHFRSNKKKCAGLLSHADQSQAAQTLYCQSRAATQLGAGGRLADALASGPLRYRATSFSLDGLQIWSETRKVQRTSLSSFGGVRPITDIDGLRSVVGNITDQAYDGIYGDLYARGLSETVRQADELGQVLDAAQLLTSFPTSTLLQRRLYQVARIIASRGARKAERDLFFVDIGGFDTHKSVNPLLDGIFAEIDGALRAFVTELRAQGTWNSTVLFTASEFGRTLTPDGSGADAGTDHGWAGNHMVLGGAVRGGRVFNDFPSTLQQDSDMDIGRGRLIPKYPYESYMVPVARWMGLADGQLTTAFPNLENFNGTTLVLPPEVLFRA